MSIVTRFEGRLSQDDLSDHIWALLCAVEDGFEKAGFTPGKDYVAQDLVAVMRPLIEEKFRDGSVCYTIATSEVENLL